MEYFCVKPGNMKPTTQVIRWPEKNISFHIRREDLIHPTIPGNKYRKLKYNLLQAKSDNQHCLLTFGGAFSNHIAATAAAGKEFGFKTIGMIRGEELSTAIVDNPTLDFARNCGMQLQFISRETYRNKDDYGYIAGLGEKFGPFYLLPEGGTNELAIKGCEEILTGEDFHFDYICVAAGTGGTAGGIIRKSTDNQQVLVFPALKGAFLTKDINTFVGMENWKLISDYHFGGYAKINSELVTFINDFYKTTGIPLDPVYTGKMVFGVMDLARKDYFPEGSKILIIHTGGIQGIKGMNILLKNKGLPLIEIDA
jgi:1-aminocyclopropane-1-carboxylate deaminase